jgi:hypothetical protein
VEFAGGGAAIWRGAVWLGRRGVSIWNVSATRVCWASGGSARGGGFLRTEAARKLESSVCVEVGEQWADLEFGGANAGGRASSVLAGDRPESLGVRDGAGSAKGHDLVYE